jgi:nicotinate phosphoribosyltransferase
MSSMSRTHAGSLALLTDLYELTMAQGYWKLGMGDRQAVFHLSFRENPFRGGYALCAGLGPVADFIHSFHFEEDDLAYLASLKGNDGQPLFAKGFLDHLRGLRFAGDVAAVPEGTVVFAHEPLVRVTGPILQCQILETALLNLINFQTLIATKAARVCQAARGAPVLEFGLRRAQGIDGGLAASRAAFIGGCAATSNLLAGKLFGIGVKGTHAPSWVMAFDDETEAFEAYAEAMPNNCVFLVDTHDTLEGVRHAVEVSRRLRERGHEVVGIRLDSGDLAALSIEARRILDESGFPDAKIVASGDLDEHRIEELNRRGAKIDIWGVGTRLTTAHDHPALSGVYKLSAIREASGEWQSRMKLSEKGEKVSLPGILQVRRFRLGAAFLADAIHDEREDLADDATLVALDDPRHRWEIPEGAAGENLLIPIFRAGELIWESPSLPEIRERAARQLGMLSERTRRLSQPEPYPVGMDVRLHRMIADLSRRAQRKEVAT